MDTRDRDLRSYYAARAAEYDRIYDKPERQADLRAIEAWLPDQVRGRRVLEVACGTGHWTPFLAAAATGVVALDAAVETLVVARHRPGTGRVEFMTGDAYDLPADLGPFDAAFAGFWFSHVSRRRQREFLRHMGSRVRPGARVVLLDNRYVEGSSTPVDAPDADGDTHQQRTLDNGTVHRVLKNFPTPGELRALVEGLGSDVEVVEWPHYWALTYRQSPIA